MSVHRSGYVLLASSCALVALLASPGVSAFEVNAGDAHASVGSDGVSASAGNAGARVGSDGSVSAGLGADGPSAEVGDGSVATSAGPDGPSAAIDADGNITTDPGVGDDGDSDDETSDNGSEDGSETQMTVVVPAGAGTSDN
jgi:hypothetical protein